MNFEFEFPTREEFQSVKELAENSVELDGRELWILENFSEGDFDE
ncbi:MAG: hypothetical protein WC308_00600 [archaeon]